MTQKGRAPARRKRPRTEVLAMEMRTVAIWLATFADEAELASDGRLDRWGLRNRLDDAARRARAQSERITSLLGTRGELPEPQPEPTYGIYHNGPREVVRPCPVCERRARQGRPRAPVTSRTPRRIVVED